MHIHPSRPRKAGSNFSAIDREDFRSFHLLLRAVILAATQLLSSFHQGTRANLMYLSWRHATLIDLITLFLSSLSSSFTRKRKADPLKVSRSNIIFHCRYQNKAFHKNERVCSNDDLTRIQPFKVLTRLSM